MPDLRDTPGDLTPREVDVLHLLARGCRNREIAHRLGLTLAQVEYSVANAKRVLGITSRARLALMWYWQTRNWKRRHNDALQTAD